MKNMKGEVCNRDGCKGVIKERDHEHDGCSCHLNPPCGYCTENLAYCPECDWDSDYDDDDALPYHVSSEAAVFKKRDIIEDDGKRYNIIRFFDHHFDGYEGVNLKNGEAERLFDKCYKRDRAYISFDKVAGP